MSPKEDFRQDTPDLQFLYLNMLFHHKGASRGDANDIFIELDKLGLYLGNGGYVIIKFSVSGMDFMSLSSPVSEKRMYILSELSDIVSKYFADKCLSYTFIIDGNVTCLISYPRVSRGTEDALPILRALKNSCRQIMNIFEKQCSLKLYVIISDLNFDVLRIAEIYERITSILSYSIFTGSLGIKSEIEFLDYESYGSKTIIQSSSIAKKTSNAIIFRDSDVLKEIAQNVVSYLTTDTFPSIQYFQFRLQCFLAFLLQDLADNDINLKFLDNLDIYPILFVANDLDSFSRTLYDFLTRINKHAAKEQHNISEKRIDDIKVFVFENISEYDLSVANIAEKFHVSQSHLSVQFKKYVGVSISDYIHISRISQIKELIKTSDKPINQLISEVGYSSISTFHRAFKKYEGISPGKLRK